MKVIEFIKTNWHWIAPALALLISEIMALTKDKKSKGIFHAILNILKKSEKK